MKKKKVVKIIWGILTLMVSISMVFAFSFGGVY